MQSSTTARGESARAPTEGLTGPIPDQLAISLFSAPATTSIRPTRLELTWPELVERFSTHERRRTKDGRGWSGATYKTGTTRANANVVAWSVAAGDFDHVSIDDYLELRERLTDRGLAFLLYSTYRSAETDFRFRVAIPLTKPVPAERYPEVWRRIDGHLFGGKNDPNTKDASRMLYTPAAPEDVPTVAESYDGLALDWEKLPAAPSLGTVKNGATKRGADVGVGRDTMEFLVFGAESGTQRGRALAATRSLLAAGKSVEETAEKVWQGLQASPCGDPARPWTYEKALEFAEDLATRKPTRLEERAGCTLDMSGGGFAAPPRANGTNGKRPEANAQAHEPAPPTTNGSAHHEGGADADDEPAAAPTFKQTEMGLSELLVHRHGRDLRYCFPWASFLAWDGRRYQRDRTGEARRRAKETVRSVYAVAAKTEDDKQRRALLDWAKTFEKAAKVAAILTLAEAEPGIPIVPEEMDADQFLFNVLNGTVNLRTGELRPHDRADNITKFSPVAYVATAECPTFLAFLERVVPDAHVRDFLRRFVGYCLTGDTSEQCL